MKKVHIIIAAAIALVAALAAVNITGAESEAAIRKVRDCDNNAILYCGALSKSELVKDFDNSREIRQIYAHYGIKRSDLTGSTSTVKVGKIWHDGRVTVDGKTVATGAHSVGRQWTHNSKRITIDGKTYYQRTDATGIPKNPGYIDAFVLMRDGQFYRAIMTSCGNPTVAKPTPKPEFKCEDLKATKISRTKFRFTADAAAKNGANIAKYHFDFGDGKNATSSDRTATHEYAKAGTYTAKVTVEFKVDGDTKRDSGRNCEVSVKVEEKPVFRCDALNARLISKEENSYEYTLSYTAENGATLESVDYDFGDGDKVTLNGADARTVRHNYAEAGTYTTTATLHFNVKGDVKSVKCETQVTISPEMCPINPSVPKDSPECEPCPIPGKEEFPKNSPECDVPPELPKTGPGEMISGGIGLGAIIAASYYWVGSRRDLMSALLNR